jgi:hypothetical protein
MQWRTLLTVLLVLPLAACLEADLTLRSDGSVAGTISWTATAGLPEQAARTLLTNTDVTIKKVELKDTETPPAKAGGTPTKARRVTAEIEAKSVAALTGIPLMKGLAVTAALGNPDAGKRTLTVRVANPGDRLGRIAETDNTVRLHLPGAVAETSAKADGNDVTWSIPSSEYRAKPAVELSVVFAAEAAPSPAK